jgi:DNA ligase-1
MARREFLQLAQTYDSSKHIVGGWYASEKLDGMRAYWDGGWTRGKLTSEVPFANTAKDYRRITPPYSTGLWTRYAKPISAPGWWLDELPDFPLDGELWLGSGRFQEVISAVKKFEPVDVEWQDIEYHVFDLPSDYAFLAPGKINNPQWTAIFEDMREFAPIRQYSAMSLHKICRMLELEKITLGTGPVYWVNQVTLPMQTDAAEEKMGELLDAVLDCGGEGLMLRKPQSIWTPLRTWDLLKVKPWLDSEATVLGFMWGRGKLQSLMGSMVVSWRDKIFELSGFTDVERELLLIDHRKRGECVPGTKVSTSWYSPHFARDTKVSFKYRELTKDGIPKEARYWRK